MKSPVLIGADPEAFVQAGQFITHCIGLLGGTKEAPRIVLHGGIQEDNVLFEFNVDPTAEPSEFLRNINEVLAQGSDILADYGLRLRPNTSSHIYDDLDGFPDQAYEFGCTPDYNAMTGEKNPRPTAANNLLRTAGGHVHIGWGHLATVTKADQEAVGCLCDYLLGLPSLLEDPDTRRRELYGKAGAMRYKAYGMEYRTLSNYWIWKQELIETIHARAQQAYTDVAKLPRYQALVSQADCQAAINNNDVVSAKAYLEILRHAAI